MSLWNVLDSASDASCHLQAVNMRCTLRQSAARMLLDFCCYGHQQLERSRQGTTCSLHLCYDAVLPQLIQRLHVAMPVMNELH